MPDYAKVRVVDGRVVKKRRLPEHIQFIRWRRGRRGNELAEAAQSYHPHAPRAKMTLA